MARRSESAEVWRDRVKRWKPSGLSARAFAELDGYRAPVFFEVASPPRKESKEGAGRGRSATAGPRGSCRSASRRTKVAFVPT